MSPVKARKVPLGLRVTDDCDDVFDRPWTTSEAYFNVPTPGHNRAQDLLRETAVWHHAEGAREQVLLRILQPKSVVVFGKYEPIDVDTLGESERVGERFEELANIWFQETLASSSLTEICSHWAYQRVIGLGPDVVPFVLAAVANGQRHWGWALAALTGENPAEDTESPKAAAESWLQWGKERGLLSDGSDGLD